MFNINKLYICIWVVSSLFSVGILPAQQHLSQPYSRYGLGEMQSRSSASLRGMGTTGYAFGEAATVNSLNPASYRSFDSLSSIIDASFSFRSHTLRESGSRQSGSTAFMEYLYLGLPVTSHWSTAFGIQPYSIVNYSYGKKDLLCERHDEGHGGTYEAFWGNSLDLAPFVSVGIQASYLFGTSFRQHELLFGDNSYLNTRSEDNYRINGLLLTAGLQVDVPVGNNRLGVGMVFTPSVPSLMRVEHQMLRLTFQSSSSENVLDTLAWTSTEKNVVREQLANPTVIGGGLSFSGKQFWIGCDVTWSQWSILSTSEPLGDSYRFSVGGRTIPAAQSSRYWKRIMGMYGVFYEKNYVQQQEESLLRYGIDFGLSFPMKKSKTRISTYVEFGNYLLPNPDDGISEQYVSLILQVQLHEKWYQRRKLD